MHFDSYKAHKPQWDPETYLHVLGASVGSNRCSHSQIKASTQTPSPFTAIYEHIQSWWKIKIRCFLWIYCGEVDLLRKLHK